MPYKPLLIDRLVFTSFPNGGVWQTVWAGLSAMIGAGIFVGFGIAAGQVNGYFGLALLGAAFVVLCSALNHVQLKNYQATIGSNGLDADIYGYSQGLLNSWFSFTAAWALALAQAATAAVAALGVSGYLLNWLAIDLIWLTPGALFVVLIAAIVFWQRLRLARRVRHISTAIGILTLLFFMGAGMVSLILASGSFNPAVIPGSGALIHPASLLSATPSPLIQSSWQTPFAQMVQATSLFVIGYAGYGRITRRTKHLPHRPVPLSSTISSTISSPISLSSIINSPSINSSSVNLSSINLLPINLSQTIALTLLAAFCLYSGVAIVAIQLVGLEALGDAVAAYVAPLSIVAQRFTFPGSRAIVAVGASCVLFGVVGDLVVELSRVLWIMGRQRDLPQAFARVDRTRIFPPVAVASAAGVVGSMVLANDVESIWTFASFAFLLHCTITNFAAFQLTDPVRSLPRWVSLLGVALCFLLIFWLEWRIWLMGAVLVMIGLMWRGINLWVAEQSEE
jgi:APA family basic amino acid/polyamine antiporter